MKTDEWWLNLVKCILDCLVYENGQCNDLIGREVWYQLFVEKLKVIKNKSRETISEDKQIMALTQVILAQERQNSPFKPDAHCFESYKENKFYDWCYEIWVKYKENH